MNPHTRSHYVTARFWATNFGQDPYACGVRLLECEVAQRYPKSKLDKSVVRVDVNPDYSGPKPCLSATAYIAKGVCQ